MIIICANCNAILGEVKPFDQDSKVDCLCMPCKEKILTKAIVDTLERKVKSNNHELK